MTPTLLPGDIIIVSKLALGPRIRSPLSFFGADREIYPRLPGLYSLNKGDIVVFNYPNYAANSRSKSDFFGEYLIKRCLGVPGDTITFTINSTNTLIINSFHPDKSSIYGDKISINNLVLPKRGQTIFNTNCKGDYYNNAIKYENSFNINEFCDSNFFSQYTFKHNYYFMSGDNYNKSNDSRYWGLLPEENILGKATMILFSLDSEARGIKKFRWDRVFKIP